jgi:2'-5' RNA ligase
MARDRAARPEAKPLRLFVAIEIPEPVKDAVEDVFAPWREQFPKARWAPRENWHITLKFLGRTWPRLADWVPERVEAAAAEVPRFRARLRGVGSFPSPKRGRALWAAFDDPNQVAELASAIETALVDEFPAEKRAFHPHLTVARSDPPVKLPPEFAHTSLLTEDWEVDHVVLFRSHLRRPAPLYEPLARFTLGAGRPSNR